MCVMLDMYLCKTIRVFKQTRFHSLILNVFQYIAEVIAHFDTIKILDGIIISELSDLEARSFSRSRCKTSAICYTCFGIPLKTI